MAGHAQFKFSAFLSYAHADARWGTWLHKRLEGYKLDRELVGRVTRPVAQPFTRSRASPYGSPSPAETSPKRASSLDCGAGPLAFARNRVR